MTEIIARAEKKNPVSVCLPSMIIYNIFELAACVSMLLHVAAMHDCPSLLA